MSKGIKVGLIIPNLQSGGAERVISTTSQLLTECGYEVYLFLFDINNISYHYKGKVIDLDSEAGTNFVSKATKRISRILKVSYYKRKYDLDVVISFLHSANTVNYYSIGRAKKILSCRGFSDFKMNGRKYSKMLKKADLLIVQTERMKQEFIQNYNVDERKISVIYNPFDTNKIADEAAENISSEIQQFMNNRRIISTIGTFKKDKGYWHLIKAFNIVKKSIPDAGLLFIGHKGEMEEEIKNMAKNTKHSNDILFLGYQANPFKFVSKSDLFVCSSLNEGFPNGLVEAMACGAPVISTDCKTGPREILSVANNYQSDCNKKKFSFGVLIPELESEIDFHIRETEKIGTVKMANEIIEILSDKSKKESYTNLSLKRSRDFDNSFYIQSLNKLIERVI